METLLSLENQKKIEAIFKNKARFNKAERIAYSHDMGVIPEQVKKMFNNIPDGVVQPRSIDELKKLVELAKKEKIPLVPRGSGTAGFGGSVPTMGGVVIDMVHMSKVLEINKLAKTCTVEAGAIWSHVEKKLQECGMALRLYPSSAKSSTVGGWTAQGGSGYGSYQYGKFIENIVEVKLLRPDGEIEILKQDRIDLVYGLCGITGIILSITFSVMDKADQIPFLVSFKTLEHASKFLNELHQHKVPLWNVSFATPSFLSLKQKASGHKLLDENRYYVTMIISQENILQHEGLINDLAIKSEGKLEDSKIAKEEWEDKFYPIRFKKLGPTLIASEVITPIATLYEMVGEIERRFNGEFAIEGTMVGPDKISILGFMLSNERKLGFPLAYANSLDVIKTGEKFGGEPFSIGMYFTDRSETFFGKEKLNTIWNYKQQHDHQGFMNPGKIMPASIDKKSPTKLLGMAMRMANSNRRLIGLAGILMTKLQGDNFNSPLNDAITNDTFNCALCGYCRDVCTVYDANPWESNSPRGKYYLMNQLIKGNIEMDEEIARKFSICSTCKKCDGVCQVDSHNTHNWMNLRFDLADKNMENTGLAAIRKNVLETGNFWGISKKDKTQWIDVPYQKKGKVAYWSGCWASTVTDNMAKTLTRILHKAGQEFVWFGEDENCCGLYLALGGYKDDFYKKVKENLELFREREVETIVFSCPGCYACFNENYPKMAEEMNIPCNIDFKHTTVYLNELQKAGRLKFEERLEIPVTYHDSCHTGRWFGHYEEPRELIQAIPGIELREMKNNRQNASCCGLVAVFDDRDTIRHTAVKRVTEAEETGANLLVTNCAGCASQFNSCTKAMDTNVRQIGLGELVAKAMGLPHEDNSEKIAAYLTNAMVLLKDSNVICSAAAAVVKDKQIK